MNQQLWTQIEEVLGDALQISPAERPGFLRARLAGQPEALLAAESLLSTEADAEVLFSQSPLESWQIAPGTILGPWRLERLIGSGGMGSVWFAQRIDGQARMEAAVKILPPALAGPIEADSSLRRRFLSEKQILSQLQHPNIARLLDAGTGSNEIPNFVMEYVEGAPLSVFPIASLSRSERLALFAKICEAIEYAHAKLIVHRDLKPHNIIIQPDGEPKLLDFGLPRILNDQPSDGALTLFRAFSLDYASPEQLRGEPISTASDIYSLGLILYELFTAERARNWANLNTIEAAHSAAGFEIPAHPALDRDLLSVLRQASHPELARRYRSVSELLADVHRLERNLPVLARTPHIAERALRFLHRHWLAASATAAILALIAFTTYSAFSASRLAQLRSQQLERALAAERHALALEQSALTTARHESQRASQSALLAARSQAQSEARVRDILQIFNKTLELSLNRVVQLPGGTKAGFDLVSTSLVELEKLSPGPQHQVDFLLARARAHALLRDLASGPNSNLGDAAAGKTHAVAAASLYEKLHRLQPTVLFHHIQMLLAGLNLDRENLGNPQRQQYWQQRFLRLTQSAPNAPEAWATLANLQFQLAVQRRAQERRQGFEESLLNYERALSMRPASIEYRRNVALNHKYLAGLKELNAAEALHHASAAVRLDREINQLQPGDARSKLDLAFSISALGDAELQSSNFAAAVALHRESFHLRSALFQADPTNVKLRRALAYPAMRWALAAHNLGQRQDVESALAAFEALPEDARTLLNEANRTWLEHARSTYATRPAPSIQ